MDVFDNDPELARRLVKCMDGHRYPMSSFHENVVGYPGITDNNIFTYISNNQKCNMDAVIKILCKSKRKIGSTLLRAIAESKSVASSDSYRELIRAHIDTVH